MTFGKTSQNTYLNNKTFTQIYIYKYKVTS